MRKNFVRMIATLLVVMMLMTSGALADVLTAELPLVSEPVTLKILTQDNNASNTVLSKAGDAPVWKFLEEKTGIHFEVESYSAEDLSTKLSLIMADPDNYPDIFWQCGLTEEQVASYGEQGMLLKLNDLIDQYAPNVKAVWDKDPAYYAYAASSDGNVYALPSYNNVGTPATLMVNNRWMENCGIAEYPKNLDELKDMLIKFRDMDANGNGDTTDEIPLQGNVTNLITIIGNACGMPVTWPYVGVLYGSDKGSTETYPIFMEERYKYLVNYMADLYAEGLIDADMFTLASDERNLRRITDIYGVLPHQTWPNAEEKYDPNEWTAIPLMTSQFIEEPTGVVGPSYQVCMAAVSAYTEHPEAVIRFLDYCMTADGTALFNNNVGVDLEASGVSADVIEAVSPYLQDNHTDWYATFGCRYQPQLVLKQGEYANNILKTIAENLNTPYSWAGNIQTGYTYSLKFTSEENEVIAQYKNDIDTYVKQKINEWIVNGQVDAEWDAYINQLKAMNVDKLTEVYQAAVNRWYGAE